MKIKVLIIISLFLMFPYLNVNTTGKKAPGIALYNMNDSLVTLSNLTKDNNVIVSFWASYCQPCIKELPQLVVLEKKYGAEKKVKLLLINIDKEGAVKAGPLLDELGISSECLLDRYQVNAKKFIPDLKIPAVFLVNRKGDIVFSASGESNENMVNLERAIKKL